MSTHKSISVPQRDQRVDSTVEDLARFTKPSTSSPTRSCPQYDVVWRVVVLCRLRMEGLECLVPYVVFAVLGPSKQGGEGCA